MPMHLADPPAEAPDKVVSKIHAFADGGHFTTPSLRGAHKDHLATSTPHQIFTMGLEDVTSGAGLERARPVGWRFLIEKDGHAVASAETTAGADGSHEVSHFNEGPFEAATDNTVKALRNLPELRAADYELRLLRIPALYMVALWLHTTASDLLVPLAPSPIGKEGKPIPALEFFAELSQLAGHSAPPA